MILRIHQQKSSLFRLLLLFDARSMEKPRQGEQGAKVWLALASDVDCTGAEAQMVQNSVPSYGKYMFPTTNQFIDFEYIGD